VFSLVTEWNQHFYFLLFHCLSSLLTLLSLCLSSLLPGIEVRVVSFCSIGSSDNIRLASSSVAKDDQGHLILRWLRRSFINLDGLLFLPYSSFDQANLLSLPPTPSPPATSPSLCLHSPPPPIFISVIHDPRAANLFS